MSFLAKGSGRICSTFLGGHKNDAGVGLALGPGEAATIVGEPCSDDLPLADAVQSRPGSADAAFVAQICYPWLGVYPAPPSSAYVGGSDKLPEAQMVDVYSGCVRSFDAVVEMADGENTSWLKLEADRAAVPMKLKPSVNPAADLAPGEYKAVVRVTIQEAFYKTLDIPAR